MKKNQKAAMKKAVVRKARAMGPLFPDAEGIMACCVAGVTQR